MVGSMYFPSVTEPFLAQPPIYLITGRGAPMQLAAESAPFRRLCDVHLKPAGADDGEEGKRELGGNGGRGPPLGGGFKR
jgi:hypothetical protein